MLNLRKTVATAAVTAVAAALIIAPNAVSASAADAPADPALGVALTPVQAVSDIAYAYFDSPSAVHADSAGIYVTCASGAVTVNFTQQSGAELSKRADVVADKAYKHGDTFVALSDGVVSAVDTGSAAITYAAPFAVSDIDICGDALYAVGEGSLAVVPFTEGVLDTASATVVELASPLYRTVEATGVAASPDAVYVSLASAYAPYKHDIAAVDVRSGKMSTLLFQSDEILSLTVMEHSGGVYALTRDRITCYVGGDGTLKEKYVSLDARMTDIYAYDGFIYAVDTLGALYKATGDLTKYSAVCASASDADGFFNSPAGAAVKNSAMYVADRSNDRIAVYGNGTLSYIENKYIDPVSVACDSRGTLYVAHDYDKVSVGDGAGFNVDGAIKRIAVNADKTVFVLSDEGLWSYDGAPDKISGVPYKDIALGVGKDELYALADDGVYKLTSSGGVYSQQRYCAAPDNAFSLAVDFAGNVFLLRENGVTRIKSVAGSATSDDFALTLGGESYTLYGGQIVLSTVDNGYVGYGCAVIVDTYKHRILCADGSAAGLDIKLIDGDDYETPDHVGDRTPVSRDGGLIRTALYDVPVFSLPIETPEIYTVKKGRKVIVPEYDLADTREFSFILVDDTQKHELIQGYVYKDSLSDPLEYVPPPADALSPYSGATPVYKWPSPHSKTLSEYSPVLAGDSLEAIDFVQEFRDYKNNLWYRVRVGDDCEGFMLAADVNLGEYETTKIRPAYNAEIISYKGSKLAKTYILKNGEYKPIDITLKVGTEVEVVGAFDGSERYTKIKCLTDLGTVTCYVETVYVEYTGVNIVLLVAIVVIIITAVLAAVIIARVVRLKKKRLTNPPDGDDGAEEE